MVYVRVADRDEATQVAYTDTFNVSRFIDKLCLIHNLNRDSLNVLHKGKLLHLVDTSTT
jgi:hypothetical protein